jgi:hypothetical protein
MWNGTPKAGGLYYKMLRIRNSRKMTDFVLS